MPGDDTERDQNGWSALHNAADLGDDEACIALLHQGADPNVRSGELVRDGELRRDWHWNPGLTPLLVAAEKGLLTTAQVLLQGGADATLADVTGWGALHAAVVGECPKLINLLMHAGAKTAADSTRRSFDEELGWFFVNTPLHLAALRKSKSTTLALLEGGGDVSACWTDRRTPLIYAAARGSTEVVELLCAHGADPTLREHRYEHGYFLDLTPLHYAARNGHRETAEVLIRLGAEPRARDSHSGLTAAEMATEYDVA